MVLLPLILLGVGIAVAARGGSSTSSATAPVHVSFPNVNRSAFLAALRMSEGTAPYTDPYSVVYGGGLFFNHADHPANTGEWIGTQTPWGSTTAAGAYQFEVGTWNDLGGAGKYGDFGGSAQDAAALDLIARYGALSDVDNGNVDAAVSKLGQVWASLPGSQAGQPTVEETAFLTSYRSAGGQVAT